MTGNREGWARSHPRNTEDAGLALATARAPQSRADGAMPPPFHGTEAEASAGFSSAPDASPAKGARCLIVDDVPAQRLILSTIVSSMDVDVDVASDGAQALLMAKQRRYDLIFMDVSMPLMDGLTATKLIRVHEQYLGLSPTQIYIVTSHDSHPEIMSADAAGANGHIKKPVMVNHIVSAIMSSVKAAPDQGL